MSIQIDIQPKTKKRARPELQSATPSPSSTSDSSGPSKIQRHDCTADKGETTEATATRLPTFANRLAKEQWINDMVMPMLSEHIRQRADAVPSAKIQSFVHKVVRKVEDPSTSIATIKSINAGGNTDTLRYLRLKKARSVKPNSKTKSRTNLVARKADDIDQAIDSVLNGKFGDETIKKIFKKLAKKRNMEVFDFGKLYQHIIISHLYFPPIDE